MSSKIGDDQIPDHFYSQAENANDEPRLPSSGASWSERHPVAYRRIMAAAITAATLSALVSVGAVALHYMGGFHKAWELYNTSSVTVGQAVSYGAASVATLGSLGIAGYKLNACLHARVHAEKELTEEETLPQLNAIPTAGHVNTPEETSNMTSNPFYSEEEDSEAEREDGPAMQEENSNKNFLNPSNVSNMLQQSTIMHFFSKL